MSWSSLVAVAYSSRASSHWQNTVLESVIGNEVGKVEAVCEISSVIAVHGDILWCLQWKSFVDVLEKDGACSAKLTNELLVVLADVDVGGAVGEVVLVLVLGYKTLAQSRTVGLEEGYTPCLLSTRSVSVDSRKVVLAQPEVRGLVFCQNGGHSKY